MPCPQTRCKVKCCVQLSTGVTSCKSSLMSDPAKAMEAKEEDKKDTSAFFICLLPPTTALTQFVEPFRAMWAVLALEPGGGGGVNNFPTPKPARDGLSAWFPSQLGRQQQGLQCRTCPPAALSAWELVPLLVHNLQREAPSLLIPLHVDILLLLTEQNERDMSWHWLRIFKGQQSNLIFKVFCGLHTISILTTQLVQKYHFHSKATLFYWPIHLQDHFLCQEGRLL